MNLHPIAEKN